MVPTGRNSRAPLRVFAPAQSVSPPRTKPASSRLGSSEEQLRLHAQLKKQNLFSKYPSFSTGKRPRLLPSSSSSPWSPLQLLQRCPGSATGPHPAHTNPRPRLNGMGRDKSWHPTHGRSDTLGAGRKDGERRVKTGSGRHVPAAFRFS